MRRVFIAPVEVDPPLPTRALNWLLVAGAVLLLFFFAFRRSIYNWDWAAVYKYRQLFLNGFLTTVVISIIALALSSLIGLAIALARRSSFLPLRYLSRLYVELVRGTPLLVQILIFFYVVADAFRLENRYVVGVLVLSFFAGAYISEVIRAGIESVGKSQLESAKAIGLTTAQTYRHVIFPQALRQSLPPMAGQFASLIKDSSLLYVIGIQELTLSAQNVASYTASTFESYLPLAVLYLILTLPISLWTHRLEDRFRFET